MLGFFGRHKILTGFLVFFLLIVVWLAWRMKGPYRSYYLDEIMTAASTGQAPGQLKVGVAKRSITPDLTKYDTWVDADNNAKFEPDKGDTYTDVNGNGDFDFVWMAGFSNNRPAKGTRDELWVRAVAVRNNGVTVALVTIDSVGIMHEKFIRARKMMNPALDVDHIVYSSTHNHEGPDTLGIWSYSILRSRFDDDYMDFVLEMCKEAVEEAVTNLQPAEMKAVQAEIDPANLVRDSRQPEVIDTKMCVAQFVKPYSEETIATIVSWGNHPEALGSDNSYISSDWPHYLRDGVENGVPEPNGAEGVGGMCLYFQGMCGGLMTTLHLPVEHRDGTIYKEAGFGQAEAVGQNAALVVLGALRGEEAFHEAQPAVGYGAQTFYAPMGGIWKIAIGLGLIHPGYYWGKARTEVDVVRVGEVEMLTCPGELYPEIGDGGITSPPGGDLPGEPVEVPPLREVMGGKVRMVLGLANDEIGYIIPRTQWDTEPPYAYGRTDKPQYGEENSPGPDVAGAYHAAAVDLLNRFHAAWGADGASQTAQAQP